MRILLTAYGPFQGVPENITERIADKIQAEWGSAEHELIILKLPVEWYAAREALVQAIKLSNPDVMISMGHAEGYSAITIETRYFNVAEGEDNRSDKLENGVISADAPPFYDTNIDADRLAQDLSKNGISVTIHSGKDGMTYLCNFTGFIAMHCVRNNGPKKPLFIFLHIPPDTMPFFTLVQGVKVVVNFILSCA